MAKKVKNKVNLNLNEIEEFLDHIIKNNKDLQEAGKVPVAVNIEGGAGIGKTSKIAQIAKKNNMNFIRLNIAQIEEIGDLVGFPIRQFQVCKEEQSTPSEPQVRLVKKIVQVEEVQDVVVEEERLVNRQLIVDGKVVNKQVKALVKIPKKQTVLVDKEIEVEETVSNNYQDGECIWIDEHALQEYINMGYKFTGNKRMSYCPPEWVANIDPELPGILCLDDYTRADQRFMQACMTLIETQKYISWELPKGWTIILTTNPDDGEYLVTSMDTAQKTRFITVDVKFDEKVWAQWAESEGIDGRCINFLLLHPEMVNKDVNPRSITTFFNSIFSITDFNKSLPLIQMIGEGSVGPEFTTMFTTFIHNRLDKLVTPKEILLSANTEEIFNKLEDCVCLHTSYRADIASVLATRLINFTLLYADEKPITDKINDRLIELTTERKVFTDDLKYHFAKKLLNGNKQKFQKLVSNPEVMKMIMK